MLTARQKILASPLRPAFQRVVPAELLVQPTLYLPPLMLLLGSLRTRRVQIARHYDEAGPLVYHRSDRRDDLDRDYITIDRIRCVISRNGMCAYQQEPR